MLTVFSDLHCPWAYVFSIRLPGPRRGRRTAGGLALLAAGAGQRARHPVGHPEPGGPGADPAGAGPLRAAEARDLALDPAAGHGGPEGRRRAGRGRGGRPLRRGRPPGLLPRPARPVDPAHLADLAAEAGLEQGAFLDAFDGGGHRRAVVADWQEGRRRGVEGSPTPSCPTAAASSTPASARSTGSAASPSPTRSTRAPSPVCSSRPPRPDLACPPAAISQHPRVLHDAGLVSVRRDGRRRSATPGASTSASLRRGARGPVAIRPGGAADPGRGRGAGRQWLTRGTGRGGADHRGQAGGSFSPGATRATARRCPPAPSTSSLSRPRRAGRRLAGWGAPESRHGVVRFGWAAVGPGEVVLGTGTNVAGTDLDGRFRWLHGFWEPPPERVEPAERP